MDVNTASGYGMVPKGKKQALKPMLNQVLNQFAMWRYQGTMS